MNQLAFQCILHTITFTASSLLHVNLCHPLRCIHTRSHNSRFMHIHPLKKRAPHHPFSRTGTYQPLPRTTFLFSFSSSLQMSAPFSALQSTSSGPAANYSPHELASLRGRRLINPTKDELVSCLFLGIRIFQQLEAEGDVHDLLPVEGDNNLIVLVDRIQIPRFERWSNRPIGEGDK